MKNFYDDNTHHILFNFFLLCCNHTYTIRLIDDDDDMLGLWIFMISKVTPSLRSVIDTAVASR